MKHLTDAATLLLAAVDKHLSPDWECKSDHPSLRPAAEKMRQALMARGLWLDDPSQGKTLGQFLAQRKVANPARAQRVEELRRKFFGLPRIQTVYGSYEAWTYWYDYEAEKNTARKVRVIFGPDENAMYVVIKPNGVTDRTGVLRATEQEILEFLDQGSDPVDLEPEVDGRSRSTTPRAWTDLSAHTQPTYEELDRIASDLQELCDRQALRLGALEQEAGKNSGDATPSSAKKIGCELCLHPLYAGLKCSNCARVSCDGASQEEEAASYLKEGETLLDRLMREREDLQALLVLYQRALAKNEDLEKQINAIQKGQR